MGVFCADDGMIVLRDPEWIQGDINKVLLIDNKSSKLLKLIMKTYILVPPPPIPKIESFSQSAIPSPDSEFRTTSEVADTETVIAYNEDLDPPPPQDIKYVSSGRLVVSFII